MDEKQILSILQGLGDNIVADMKVIIELNGKMATSRLYDSLEAKAFITNDEKFNLAISYLFYGKYIDEGRRPGKQPPLQAIKEWTRLKGIPESAAFPIARKIGQEGYRGINFTEPFYDDIGVIKDIMGDAFAKYIVKVLIKDDNK